MRVRSKLYEELTPEVRNIIGDEAKKIIEKIISATHTSMEQCCNNGIDLEPLDYYDIVKISCNNNFHMLNLPDEEQKLLLIDAAIHYLGIVPTSEDFELRIDTADNLLEESLNSLFWGAYCEKYGYYLSNESI